MDYYSTSLMLFYLITYINSMNLISYFFPRESLVLFYDRFNVEGMLPLSSPPKIFTRTRILEQEKEPEISLGRIAH